MHIFIDESGNFVVPATGQRNLSCVGALVVPEAKLQEVTRRFDAVKREWGVTGEIKGSSLDELQVNAVINALILCDCLFFITATEMSVNDVTAMNAYQKTQAEYLTDGVPNTAHPELRKQVTALRADFERMPSQLFIQTVLLTDLLKKSH